MAVAKTYSSYPIEGEPFEESGRMYVNIIMPKGIKKVRWYSDAEYQRMYPEETKNDIMDFDARTAFGFGTEGYIFLFKGKNVEEWAENDRRNIWYNLIFGYYTPGRLEYPSLSEGIKPVKLEWSEVMDHGNRMKPHEQVKRYVDCLLVDNISSTSQYQGTANEWLQKEVKIKEKKSNETHFGTKHTYTLEDAKGNLYVWETGTKDYSCNETVSLKMKVKEHKEINGAQTTVVWYCKEV